jgi:hypothetical protein
MEILKLQAALRTGLGSPLSDHVYLAHIDPEKLVLYTDSPVWAAKLRFLTGNILAIIKEFPPYNKVTSVRIKINPSLNSVFRAESHLHISAYSSQHLEKVAETIDDAGLQSSLLKLAQNR